MDPWTYVGISGLLVAVLAVSLGLTLRQLAQARSKSRANTREVEATRLELTALRTDQQVQTQFVREFLELSKKLDSLASARMVPMKLLETVVRTFDPTTAIVLQQKGEDRPRRLTVVALYPQNTHLRMGMEFPAHEGELGLVIRAQRVMTREDFLTATNRNAIVGRKESIPGLSISFAAPIQFKNVCHGVIVVCNPRRKLSSARDALGLIAQMGALAIHNSAQIKKVQANAALDKLTQVANKASIRDFLEKEITRAIQLSHRSSILLFDLDNFKNYNDVNGHLAGDELLRDLARMVKQATREYDQLGRFGGEEFLLVLPETDSAGAMAVAEKVRSMIASHPFAHREKQPLGVVSISGGVATFPENGRDADTLLKLADEALYQGKETGRNVVTPARRLAVVADIGGPRQPA